MMCYRDMTFCDGADRRCANFDKCDRALTFEVAREASIRGLLVSRFEEPEKLDCFVPTTPFEEAH